MDDVKDDKIAWIIVDILEYSDMVKIQTKSNIEFTQNTSDYLIEIKKNDYVYIMEKWIRERSHKFI